MKQLFIFNEASNAAIYGIGTYITQLTSHLSNLEFELNVVHLRSGESEFRTENILGVNYYYFPYPKNFAGHGYEEYNDRYYRNIFYVLYPHIKDKPIFHLNYNQSIALVQYIRKRFPESKVIYTIHYLGWCFSLQGDVNYFKQIINKTEEKITDAKEINILKSFKREQQLFSRMDKVICLSHFTYGLLRDDYKISTQTLTFIPNALVEDSSDTEKSDRISLRKKYYFDPKEKLLLYAGRLEKTKGIINLLQAFQEVLKIIPACRLIIAGNGDFDTCLKECSGIWPKVTFTGRVDKEQLYKLYRMVDIGIIPSFHEQSSYVAIEMMMHGLPIISTNACGVDEMFTDIPSEYKVSIRYENGSAQIQCQELKASIIRLLESSEMRIKIGQIAKMNYKSHYNLEKTKKNICKLFSDC